MHSRLPVRRLLLPGFVALAIAVQATGAVLALNGRSIEPVAVPDAVRAVVAPAHEAAAVASATAVTRSDLPRAVARRDRGPVGAITVAAPARQPARVVTPTAQTQPPKAATPPAAVSKPATTTTRTSTAYRGRNHVWIPSLGINRAVEFFPCPRTKPPGHQIYSWGCAGRNNVYLFGHAASVMRPLHDAYYSKRLKVGMKVIYADGNGKVRTYKVSFWKVVSPVDSGWAFAAQSRPSMTLQTCVGANSQWRLVVRLVAAG